MGVDGPDGPDPDTDPGSVEDEDETTLTCGLSPLTLT